MEKGTFQPSFDVERRFAKIKLFIAGWVGELACHQKAFQPTIHDSQGQVSSNKLSYKVYFIIGGGYSNEFKCIFLVQL